jgi:ATP/maltotriose-dependent transcriptional regulator MalT
MSNKSARKYEPLEHLGGNYQLAEEKYKEALAGLRHHERSRAASFVLMGLADVTLKRKADGIKDALILVDEAIGLAQLGGHEDLRVLAGLTKVRLLVQSERLAGEGLFEQLSAAQRYAVTMDIPRIACEAHSLRARLLSQQGEYRLSAAEATASLEIASLYDLKLKKARSLLTLAQIYCKRGDIDGARSMIRMGEDIASSSGYYTCVKGFRDLEVQLERPLTPFDVVT